MKSRGLPGRPVLLLTLISAFALASMPASAQSPPVQASGGRQPNVHWHKVSVTLPVSTTLFPAGEGAASANSQCLICHSASMVLSQPQRTEAQWKETINKMRNVYGAPLPVEQVEPLAAYFFRALGHESGQSTQAAAAETADSADSGVDGAAVFAGHCAVCHQTAGTGLPGVFPPLAGSGWVNGQDATLVQIVLHGVQGDLTVNGVTYKGAMPAFADQLRDIEIARVLTFIRSQWGNKAAPVEVTVVKAQRTASAARNLPWSGDAELR